MRKLLFVVISFFALAACQDENGIKQSPAGELLKWTPAPAGAVTVVSDRTALTSLRVAYGAGIGDILTRASETVGALPAEAIQDGFLELATVTSPEDPSGNPLSATSVQVFGKYAVVCYHMHYKGLGGALQLLNIEDPTAPQVISEFYYENLDFNHIAFDNVSDAGNSKFWAAADDSKKGYAYVITGNTSNGAFTAQNVQLMRVPGNSANCIVKHNNNVIVATTGVKEVLGAILSFNYQTGVVDEVNMNVQRGKHVAIDPAHPETGLIALYLKDCDNGNYTQNQTSTGLPVLTYFANDAVNPLSNPTSWDLERIKPIDGKNAIRLYDGIAYMALSNQGMGVMNIASGDFQKYDLPDDGLTNGIDVDRRYIYLANGSGGVHVYSKATLDYKYTFYGNTTASANFTSAIETDASGLLFVAYGIDGVKIICTKGCYTKEEEICYGRSETAWSTGPKFGQNWATYTPYNGTAQVVDIYAGQHYLAGTVSFSDVADGKVTLTIKLNGWALKNVEESVKIQGYDTTPPAKTAPGQFKTYKGTELTVTVGNYKYFGIHLDVIQIVDCSQTK